MSIRLLIATQWKKTKEKWNVESAIVVSTKRNSAKTTIVDSTFAIKTLPLSMRFSRIDKGTNTMHLLIRRRAILLVRSRHGGKKFQCFS